MTYKGFIIVEMPEFYRVSGGGEGWYTTTDVLSIEMAKEFVDKQIELNNKGE